MICLSKNESYKLYSRKRVPACIGFVKKDMYN